MESPLELKNLGNAAFSQEKYDEAIDFYSKALRHDDLDLEMKATLLSNRSACYIKVSLLNECIRDCTEALTIQPRMTKALYRRATAHKQLHDYKNAINDLRIIISMDANNKEAQNMLREVTSSYQREQLNDTEVMKILSYIESSKTNAENGLKNLIALCSDDKSHAMDFGRKNGIRIVVEILEENKSQDVETAKKVSVLSIRALTAMCNHSEFVMSYINFNPDIDRENHLLSFAYICSLLCLEDDIARGAVTLIMYIFRAIPSLSIGSTFPETKENIPITSTSLLFLQETTVKVLLKSLLETLKSGSFEMQAMTFDLLTAFFSDIPDYFSSAKELDFRLESMDERKSRFSRERFYRFRSSCHARWAVDVGLLDQLIECLDGESVMSRQRAGPCFGRLLSAYNNVEELKKHLQPYIVHGPPESGSAKVEQIFDPSDFPPIDKCRRRAAVEVALLLQPSDELSTWALPQPGGIAQLLLLISTQDERCQLIASEVFCLAASNENTSSLLSTVVSSGALRSLMDSPNPAIRAAGVSTLTKLSIKSKAIDDESPETSHILHTVLSVINSFDTLKSKSSDIDAKQTVVGFSKVDKKLAEPIAKPHEFFLSQVKRDDGLALTSVERAVEVLAAMVGRTHVKEELVHGSNRVAAAMPVLLKLADEMDVRSTAAYGLAHIMASLTVTNHELRLKALAEKEMTNEQYEQLKELQRIKTKDEEGNPLEELKEPDDPDNNTFCRHRIKKLIQADAVPVLLKLLAEGSPQTKDAAARSLSQMMVEESIRGIAIQQGLIKACCAVVMDADTQKKTKIAAAHAIAKSLVTTNPNVLSEHLRLSSFGPLLYLCKEVDASNLEQFEALLSITNLLSCGEAEINKFAHDKGIQAIHYLMFSDHLMVRRAAAEACVNLGNHEILVTILRQPEKVRFWLALSEDWNNEENPEESYKIARCTSATIAMNAADEEIARALIKEDIAKSVIILLESEKPELIQRALIAITAVTQTIGIDGANHFLHGGVIPAIGVVTKLGNEQLAALAKETAMELSKAIRSVPVEASSTQS